MGAILCEHCIAYCCRYIALPIDTPTEPRDFDDIRWYLLHEDISIFVEDGDWYICIQTRCRHLQPDHRCGIYERRPRICREYSTDNCDYHSGDYGWEHHLTCPEHLDEYLRTHAPWKQNGASRRRRGGTGTRQGGKTGRGRPADARRQGGKAGRPRVRARLDPARTRPRQRSKAAYGTTAADIRGIPLPVLELR